MKIIRNPITRQELVDRYTSNYPNMTKAVVDVERRIMAVDAEWHVDLEAMLLDDGSAQRNLWGINLQLIRSPEEFIVYESLINIRPAQHNFQMEVMDEGVRAELKSVVDALVDYGQTPVMREPAAAYGKPADTAKPVGFRQHKQLTMDKWRSFPQYKRVLMTANEIGRARANIGFNSTDGACDCWERALELFQITIDAAQIENAPHPFIHGLLRLRERVARLYVEKRLDAEENARLYDELIALDPKAWEMLHPVASRASATGLQ